ncbi:MAG: hypothetical protein K8T91_18845 [Planctomycetes bacterium]|nr:hypothetical protein [Planctomycetota bacterium]
MKQAKDLTCDQIVALVQSLQNYLYLDQDAQGRCFWNPDKSWNSEGLGFLAEALGQYDLLPDDSELVKRETPVQKYVLYDFDRAELIGSRIYDDRGLAGDDASELNHAIVVPLILPQPTVSDPAEEPQPCECQLPEDFCCGVPGILAKVENCRVVLGGKVERCDLCQRYPSDQAAHDKLVELGMA